MDEKIRKYCPTCKSWYRVGEQQVKCGRGHEGLQDKDTSPSGRAKRAQESRGQEGRSMASKAANWTMAHGKDDDKNPYSKKNRDKE